MHEDADPNIYIYIAKINRWNSAIESKQMSYQRPLNNGASNQFAASQQRLSELLEGVKKEFDSLSNETSIYKIHQDEVEIKFSQQNQELATIRNTVYELEMAHRKMKEAYEEEIMKLKQELEGRDRVLQPPSLTTQNSQPQQQQQLPATNGAPALERPGSSGPPAVNAHYFPQTPQQLAPPQLTTQQHASTHLPLPPQQIRASPNGLSLQPQFGDGMKMGAPVKTEVAQSPALNAEPSPDVESRKLAIRAEHNKPIPAFLNELDSYAVLPYKKQHSEYYVLFNPELPKKIDIELVHSLEHTSVVCCVKFSKDGKFLATGCNKVTQVFGVETGELVAKLSDDSASAGGSYDTDTGDLYIRSVCFSPDGKYLATGAEDKLIRIWDLSTRTIVKLLKGHEQDIYSLDFFPDGSKLVSGSGDRTVRIWDLVSSQCALTLSIEDGVTTVAVSPDGKLIAAGSLDRIVRVWDANTGFLVERLDSEGEGGNGHKDSVYSVTFTQDGKEITSGSLDRTVKLWSLNNSQQNQMKPSSNCEVTYVGHKDFVLSVCATADGEYVLSGSKDRGVIIWEKETGSPLLMLQGHRNSVISVSVNQILCGPGGGFFATGSGDCKARIWRWTRV